MAGNTRGRAAKTVEQRKRDNKDYHPARHGYGAIQAPEGTIRKPYGFAHDKLANALWNQIVPELAKMGHVAPLDVPKIQAMCQFWSDYCKLRDEGAKQTEISSAFKMFSDLSIRFGMDPLSRQKLREWKQPEQVDELDELLSEPMIFNAQSG